MQPSKSVFDISHTHRARLFYAGSADAHMRMLHLTVGAVSLLTL